MSELDQQLRVYFDALTEPIEESVDVGISVFESRAAGRDRRQLAHGPAVLELEPASDARPRRGRRVGAAVAVAAMLAVVAGVGVLVRDGGDGVTTESVAPLGVTDGSSYEWVRVAGNQAVFAAEPRQWMNDVAAGGPGFVAVGSVERGPDADAAVWVSADGEVWSRVPHDEEVFEGAGRVSISAVTAGGPGLVAVGWSDRDGLSEAAVWTSVDGLVWSRVALEGAEGLELNDVVAGGPGLVAVGWSQPDATETGAVAAVLTSSNGLSWSRVPHDDSAFAGGPSAGMNSVTVGGPGLVAVGVGTGQTITGDGREGSNTTAAVWTSTDGLRWSRVPHDETVFGGATGDHEMTAVTVAGRGLVAVGSFGDEAITGAGRDAAVWASPDGHSWSRVPHDPAVFGGARSQFMRDVVLTDAGLVAVGSSFYGNLDARRDRHGWYEGQDAHVWTTSDGSTWNRVPHDDATFGGAAINSLVLDRARLVAVGGGSTGASPDEPGHPGNTVSVWRATPSAETHSE